MDNKYWLVLLVPLATVTHLYKVTRTQGTRPKQPRQAQTGVLDGWSALIRVGQAVAWPTEDQAALDHMPQVFNQSNPYVTSILVSMSSKVSMIMNANFQN